MLRELHQAVDIERAEVRHGVGDSLATRILRWVAGSLRAHRTRSPEARFEYEACQGTLLP